MNKIRKTIEWIAEPKNAVAIGVAGAFIFSAAFANASFFTAANLNGIDDTSTNNTATTGGSTTNTGTFFTSLVGTTETSSAGTSIFQQANTTTQTGSGSFFNSGTGSTGVFGTTTASNLKVMAIGDGIAAGVGATSGNDFVSLLAQGEGVTIQNLSASGLTTAQVLSGIDSVLASNHPQVVILMLGANDQAAGVSAQTEFTNLETIVSHIQATGAKVVVVGDESAAFDSGYEANYSQVASLTNSYYVPNALSGILGNTSDLSDSTHLNNQGHLLIAQRIDPTFRTALNAAANGGTGTTTNPNALQVSCAANPATASIGQSLSLRATAVKGTGNYSYRWTGSDGLTGNGRQLTGYYATTGTKTATVTVTSGNETATASCSVAINSTPQVGACFFPNSNVVNPRGVILNTASSNTFGAATTAATFQSSL